MSHTTKRDIYLTDGSGAQAYEHAIGTRAGERSTEPAVSEVAVMSDEFLFDEHRIQIASGFHGFHTSICEVGNRKIGDGGGSFTDFTDFTPSEKRVYVASAHARTRARTRRHTCTPFGRREIREIREIARRGGGKFALLSPPGVKSVKSPPLSDSGVIA